MSEVKLHGTSGTVFIESNGKKRKVEARIPESLESLDTLVELYGENTVPIADNDVIITEEESYAINIQDENDPDYTTVSLFPDSRAKLSVKGKEITEVKLMHGLFRVETKNPIHVPLAQIDYLDDSTHFFFIGVKEDEVAISLVSGHAEVTHQKVDEKVTIQTKEQATVTPTSIKGPHEVEQKFKKAFKKQREFASKISDLYDDASLLQQKTYISDMEDQISQSKQEIRELEKEGGSVPARMKMGLRQLEKQLKEAKKEFREEITRKRQEEKNEKELSEFEKDFRAREQKFEKELEKMSKETSSETTSAQTNKRMTELEKKIQAAGKDLEDKES